MSCPTCGSEYCDGEKCSENNDQDPYPVYWDDEDDDDDDDD